MNTIDVMYGEGQEMFKESYPEDVILDRISGILSDLGLENVEMSCSFVSDEEIRRLNAEWRDRDESTDILSFVQEDGEAMPSADGNEWRMLGDLVISPESLKRNSEYFTVSLDEELHRLLVHGMLHLLGDDHATNDPQEPMLIRQEEMLRRLRG
ncbi:rRNA maturation RNase YbeY [Parasphaerochaeta coccoides]|uniref:Endoribonuclease YbeY n=1 Tax=Parasphaerochaeta coccoides (strain ATCC BAA-1237 / DSM 17374 / SPN1) TaxID=760011 RepID=F4GII9_PARC1|nr:rRNA maturation RNase YbeY [Parasphaerochaeta coccoides]AEC01697.1 metalloprotease ybeY [Parasphaerochaeta coccoides DSM 17374]